MKPRFATASLTTVATVFAFAPAVSAQTTILTDNFEAHSTTGNADPGAPWNQVFDSDNGSADINVVLDDTNRAPDLLAWWRADTPPELVAPDPTTVSLEPIPLREPVLLEFLSGFVFSPPKSFSWGALPVFDAPLALVERATLPQRPL